MDAGPARAARLARRGTELAAAALLALHFASFAPREQPIVSDVRISLYDAWRVSQGAVPHRDLYAVKTPLATLLGAGLHRAAEGLDLDPLLALRAAYLALSFAAGLLAFAAFRALSGGSGVAGLLAALALCGFGLLGLLPAIGNVPKHAAAVCAWGAGLCALRARWRLGGALAALAFLDWQVGALVAAGLLLAARWDARGLRGAAPKLAQGAALVLAPFGAWLASHAALRAFGAQTLAGAFARGASAFGEAGAAQPWQRIARSAEFVCPEQQGLVWLALAAVGLVAWQLRQDARGAARVPPALRRLRVALAVPMAGVVAFSALDFQAYGDWLALLHALAFFLASAFCAAHRGLQRALAPRAPAGVASAAALLLALAAARPGPLRPELSLRAWGAAPGLTLSEQRALARAAEPLLGSRELAALDAAELLYLLRRVNPLPVAYWDRAAYSALARAGETPEAAATRLLGETGAAALIFPRGVAPLPPLAGELQAFELSSPGGRYRVRLHLR